MRMTESFGSGASVNVSVSADGDGASDAPCGGSASFERAHGRRPA